MYKREQKGIFLKLIFLYLKVRHFIVEILRIHEMVEVSEEKISLKGNNFKVTASSRCCLYLKHVTVAVTK